MSRSRWIRAGMLAGLVLWTADARTIMASDSKTQVAEGDRAFLKQALGVNELELRLGHLASERGTTNDLKAMGQKMIQTHTRFGQQLRDLAEQSGISGDPEMSPEQRATLARLEAQPDEGFGATFKRTVDEGHVKELAMYRDEVGRAADPQLRALAEQRVTALQKSMAAVEQPGPAGK